MTFDHTAGVAAAEAILVRRVTACIAAGLHALGGHCDACGVTAQCGYQSPHQGQSPHGPTSPCTLPADHVEYHRDDSGLPYGPWIEGGPRLVQEGRADAERELAHEHESWQIRRKPGGGRYCAACGETTSERTER